MNGTLAQAVALVAHGNAWLRAPDSTSHPDDFELTNSTFQYVRSVRFDGTPNGERPATTSVSSWIGGALDAGVGRLSLIAGGASFGVLGHAEDTSTAWYPSWTVNRDGVDPKDLKSRIWEVHYATATHGGDIQIASPDIAAATKALHGALVSAREFARHEQALEIFASWFDRAIELMTSDDPSVEYHPDLLPSVGYALDARRLIAMGVRAWVFGGMRSWNDVVIRDEDLKDAYRHVTERLYSSSISAIRDAANAFDK